MSLRVAMLSVHTSPLHQPGTGDAGGMNVYMVQLSRALAEQGVEVDLFTRCRGEARPSRADLGPGVRVRHLEAGPRAALPKEDMPALVVPFSLALLKEERRYDLVHSHYWLSGQAGRIAAAGWRIPLVHTAHTLARVKNEALAAGDTPEPELRIRGEHQVVGSADRLIANTGDEARALRELYGADARRTEIVRPGVDLRTFGPGRGRAAARARLGLPADAFVPLYAGRIQPLKGPDVMVRAIAELLREVPGLRRRIIVPVVGGNSGAGPRGEAWELARELGVSDVLRHYPPVPQSELAQWYRAADVLMVPSRSESFGLVALEAQACGTPVLASAVGGLPTAVRDGVTGLLVPGNDPVEYARRLRWFAQHPQEAALMGRAAVCHAREMSWQAAAARTLEVYRDVLREEKGGADMSEAGAAARSCLADASPLEGREGRKATLTALLT
ncbi:D-inositol-3-phosphate glycosyltransferase [Streptomyces sp. NBC_00091]|uniref:D-inositol-3-phosphate glycosyltransferase n=1 Tax=Streptomyces sp. NBC_00091 TaxID=2975648 RepID=UPI002255DD77|nr:D-inositol-3-phosphate glycosyltransferase [Streptomyces sp. NBC_00091]MCX5375079.1 D-inositol-3-phosphate glycosyltransferase [Streptomyces sp. NBC_00091]